MGNQLVALAPSQIFPVEQYINELHSCYRFKSRLGSTRFMKVAKVENISSRAVAAGGIISRAAANSGNVLCGYSVVKVFVLHNPTVNLRQYSQQLKDHKERLSAGSCHCLPFYVFTEADSFKFAYIVRPYIKSSLYNRMNTRPFWSYDEKLWIAFQLLWALEECHAVGVCHGDIKTENVMITSWNWVYVTDFAPFKPVLLPEDNPSDFSYYFDTSGRRVCYVAPERFRTATGRDEQFVCLLPGDEINVDIAVVHDEGGRAASRQELESAAAMLHANSDSGNVQQQQRHTAELTSKMDIFSAGCVLIELFSDGEAPFDLSTLLQYVHEQYYPRKALERVKNVALRDMLKSMINRNPNDRLEAGVYLSRYRNSIFPDYFYSFLKIYMHQFSLLHHLNADQRLVRLSDDMVKCSTDATSDMHATTIVADMPVSNDTLSQVLIILLPVLTSCLRQLRKSATREEALFVIEKFARHLPSSIVIDRLLPYILHFVGDKFARNRAQIITVIVNILRHIDDIRPEDAHLHIAYVLPAFVGLAQDQSVHVRITYARSIAELARSGLRFLQQAQLKQAFADSMPSPATSSTNPSTPNSLPHAGGAVSSFPSFSTTDVAAAGGGVAQQSRSRINFHVECRALQTSIAEVISAFMHDPNSEVKKSLLRSTIITGSNETGAAARTGSGLAYLFEFFGIQKSLEVLFTHMATFLNEKHDHELRAAFFENVFGIGLALMPNAGVSTPSASEQFMHATSVPQFRRSGKQRKMNSNAADSGQLLHPLLEQGISDASELVISTALDACQSLVFAGAMNEVQVFGLVDLAMPLLLHPSPNIRQGVVSLITTTYKRFGFARFLYRVRDRLQFFLVTPVIIADTNAVVSSALKPPVTSALLNLLVNYDATISPTHDDEAFEGLMQRWSQQVLADIRNGVQHQPADSNTSTFRNFVISDAELEKMKRPTYMLYDKLRARNILTVRGGPLESAVLMYPILSRIRKSKRSSTDMLESEVLRGSRRSSSTAILSSLSTMDAQNHNAYFEIETSGKTSKKCSGATPAQQRMNNVARLPFIPVPHRNVRTYHLEQLKSKSSRHAKLTALPFTIADKAHAADLGRQRSTSMSAASVRQDKIESNKNVGKDKQPTRADSEQLINNRLSPDLSSVAEGTKNDTGTPTLEMNNNGGLADNADDIASMLSSTTSSSAGTLTTDGTVVVQDSEDDDEDKLSFAAITASSDSNTADEPSAGISDASKSIENPGEAMIATEGNRYRYSLICNEHEEAFKYEQGALYRKLEALVQQQHHRLVASKSSSSHLDYGSAAAASVAAGLHVPSSSSDHQFDVSSGHSAKDSTNTLLPLMSNAFAPGFPIPLPPQSAHDAGSRHHHHQRHHNATAPPPFIRRARHKLPRGILVAHMQEHSSSVSRIRVHPVQSHVFATCSKDGSVKIWNAMRIENAPASASNAVTATTSANSHSSAVVPNKSRQTYLPFAGRGRQQSARASVSAASETASTNNASDAADDGETAQIATIHFCQWGTAMVVGASDGRFCVLDVERDTYKLAPQQQSALGRYSANIISSTTTAQSNASSSIVESLLLDKYTTECTFAVAHVNGTINAYDLRTPSARPIWNVQHDASLGLIRATCTGSPYQTWFVTGTAEGHLVLWDQRYLVPVKTVCHSAGYAVSALRAHPVGNAFLIAAFCGRNEIVGWKLDTDTPVVKFSSDCDYLTDAGSAIDSNQPHDRKISESSAAAAAASAAIDDPFMSQTIRGIEIVNVGPLDSDLSVLTAGTDCRVRVWDSIEALDAPFTAGSASGGYAASSNCGIIVPAAGEPAPALLMNSAHKQTSAGKSKSGVSNDRRVGAAPGGYWPTYRAKVSDGILCVQELWSFRIATSGSSASTRSGGGLGSPSPTSTSANAGSSAAVPPSAPSPASATDSEMFYMRHFYDPWSHPHIDAINDIALINTEHQQFLASASRDGVVKLWK